VAKPLAAGAESPWVSATPELVARLRSEGARGLARAISAVERGDASAPELVRLISAEAPSPAVVGLTGAPGSGKSSLAGAVVAELRGRGHRVAVLAVDPSSPFSGGALLGDRIRLQRHAQDEGVYIRSLAARGHLGGLSPVIRDAIRLVAGFGFGTVILETVGVGQSELEVASVAETTIVVLAPGFGDGIQLMKAGVMEIADIYCLNKADLSGADQLRGDLRGFIASLHKRPWPPPLVATVATTGQGVGDLWEAVERHRAQLADFPEAEGRRSKRLCDEAAELVAGWARLQAGRILREDSSLRQELEADNDPQAVLARLAERLRWTGPGGTR